eukprot:gene6631-7377_t
MGKSFVALESYTNCSSSAIGSFKLQENKKANRCRRKKKLKRTRANAKLGLTRALKQIDETILAESSLSEVNEGERNLNPLINSVVGVRKYRNSIVDEDDLDESLAYCHEVKVILLAMQDRITLRYEYYQQHGEAAHEDDVTPEDSVSQIYSTEQSCKSSRSSVRSGDLLLQGNRPTNATRRASLMAEASFIKLKRSLTNQKIRLQQELEDLDTKMQFRKLEAEDEVFDEFETAMSHTQSAPPNKPE